MAVVPALSKPDSANLLKLHIDASGISRVFCFMKNDRGGNLKVVSPAALRNLEMLKRKSLLLI